MENLDSRLLRNQEEERGAAEELKNRRSGSGDEGGDKTGADGEPRSLRQRAQAARQALNVKEQAKKKLEEKVAAPAKIGTSNALRWAWLTLIPSFGLSLIYINIHVFLRMVLGEKLFCKLGEEWIPKQVSAAGGEAGKSLSKSVGIIEVMGLVLLDLGFLFAILLIFTILVLLVDAVANPISTTWKIGWDIAFNAIKSLLNITK